MVDLYGNDKGNRIIGAAEKRMKARQYKAQSGFRFTKETVSPVIAIALAYFLSCMAAMLLTDGPLKAGLDYSFLPSLKQYLFGPGNPSIVGSAGSDRIIAILIRGFIIFVGFALPPVITQLWQVVVSKESLSPYIAMWLTSTALFLAVVFAIVA